MRVLAESYTPQELNKHGFGLYAEFRPDVAGWGAKGEVRCDESREKFLARGADLNAVFRQLTA